MFATGPSALRGVWPGLKQRNVAPKVKFDPTAGPPRRITHWYLQASMNYLSLTLINPEGFSHQGCVLFVDKISS